MFEPKVAHSRRGGATPQALSGRRVYVVPCLQPLAGGAFAAAKGAHLIVEDVDAALLAARDHRGVRAEVDAACRDHRHACAGCLRKASLSSCAGCFRNASLIVKRLGAAASVWFTM